jgi:hypothetical protein
MARDSAAVHAAAEHVRSMRLTPHPSPELGRWSFYEALA